MLEIAPPMLRPLTVASLLLAALPVHAQLPEIEVLAWSRSAAQIGTSCELQVASGNHAEELSQLLFSQPGIQATPRTEKPVFPEDEPNFSGVFDVSIDPSIPAGVCEVRGVGRFGISSPRVLLLTQQPIAVVDNDHSDPALAVPLQPHTIAAARCKSQRRNYYSLQLSAGERLHLAAYAQQIDSRATPTIILYDPQHREVARSRAVGGWPAEIWHTAAGDGDYRIAIHDFLFLGGSEFSYLVEYSLDQELLELDRLLRIDCQSPTAGRRTLTPIERFAALSKAQRPTDAASLWVQDRFQSGSSVIHDFVARKDDALWIEVASHGLGQLTDPQLVLYRKKDAEAQPTFQQLVEQDDPAALGDASMRIQLRDPQFAWQVPEDGEYRLEIRDLEGGQRPKDSRNYSLAVQPQQPHFQLLAYPRYPSNNPATASSRAANIMRGGTASIDILVSRKSGFSDAIEITLENLPAGVSAAPIVIPASLNHGSATMVCTADAPVGHSSVSVVGRSSGDSANTAQAQVGTVLWPGTPTHNAVQCRITSQLFVSVMPVDIAPLYAELGGPETLEVAQGGKLSIPVTLTRREGGQAACLMRPQQLPPQVTLPEFTIAADKSEGTAEISVGESVPLGEFSFWLQNETKIKWRENPQALARAEAQVNKLNEALKNQAKDKADQPATEAALAQAKQRVEALKQSTAEKEITVWFPTSNQRVRVIPKS